MKKTKFVSNDRSGHDDQFCPKIVKIGAILAIFRPFEDFGLYGGGRGGGKAHELEMKGGRNH